MYPSALPLYSRDLYQSLRKDCLGEAGKGHGKRKGLWGMTNLAWPLVSGDQRWASRTLGSQPASLNERAAPPACSSVSRVPVLIFLWGLLSPDVMNEQNAKEGEKNSQDQGYPSHDASLLLSLVIIFPCNVIVHKASNHDAIRDLAFREALSHSETFDVLKETGGLKKYGGPV